MPDAMAARKRQMAHSSTFRAGGTCSMRRAEEDCLAPHGEEARSAVSNHKIIAPHPSRRGHMDAPQDEVWNGACSSKTRALSNCGLIDERIAKPAPHGEEARSAVSNHGAAALAGVENLENNFRQTCPERVRGGRFAATRFGADPLQVRACGTPVPIAGENAAAMGRTEFPLRFRGLRPAFRSHARVICATPA
jgi:hypothetical protein